MLEPVVVPGRRADELRGGEVVVEGRGHSRGQRRRGDGRGHRALAFRDVASLFGVARLGGCDRRLFGDGARVRDDRLGLAVERDGFSRDRLLRLFGVHGRRRERRVVRGGAEGRRGGVGLHNFGRRGRIQEIDLLCFIRGRGFVIKCERGRRFRQRLRGGVGNRLHVSGWPRRCYRQRRAPRPRRDFLWRRSRRRQARPARPRRP